VGRVEVVAAGAAGARRLRLRRVFRPRLLLAVVSLALIAAIGPGAPAARADETDPGARPAAQLDVAGGRFFLTGEDDLGLTGFAVIDEPAGPPFWSAYQALGGQETLGAPLTRPFALPDARTYQLFERAMLRGWPGAQAVEMADTMDLLWAAGRDDWLAEQRVPRAVTVDGASPEQALLTRLGWLTFDAIRDAYFTTEYPGAAPGLGAAQLRYGLPAGLPVADDERIVQRFDKVVVYVDLATGGVTTAPVGALVRDAGLLPPAALLPDRLIGGQLVGRPPRVLVNWPNSRGWGVPEPGGPAALPVAGGGAAASVMVVTATATALPPAATATPVPAPTATPRPGGSSGAPAATSTARATPTGAPPAAGAALSIKAIVNQGRAEHVVVANEGSAAQELTGWVIRSAAGGQVLPFPSGFVPAAGATVTVHSGTGASAQNRPPTDLFATGANVWNNNGDTAELLDPSGRVVSQLSYAG